VLVAVEPDLSNDERLAVAKAVAQFNRGRYFESHEILEGVWSGIRGVSRDFFQALIQVSVGFHHLERGNPAGARKTFTRALVRFGSYPAGYFGFDVAAERSRLHDRLTALDAGSMAGLESPPIWRFDGLPIVENEPRERTSRRPQP
jgi:predicted metal-dependent hydrolase